MAVVLGLKIKLHNIFIYQTKLYEPYCILEMCFFTFPKCVAINIPINKLNKHKIL